jgi:hypothetical protein
MLISNDDDKELRRLIGLASDGFLLGWLVDFHETLTNVRDQVGETHSRLPASNDRQVIDFEIDYS